MKYRYVLFAFLGAVMIMSMPLSQISLASKQDIKKESQPTEPIYVCMHFCIVIDGKEYPIDDATVRLVGMFPLPSVHLGHTDSSGNVHFLHLTPGFYRYQIIWWMHGPEFITGSLWISPFIHHIDVCAVINGSMKNNYHEENNNIGTYKHTTGYKLQQHRIIDIGDVKPIHKFWYQNKNALFLRESLNMLEHPSKSTRITKTLESIKNIRQYC